MSCSKESSWLGLLRLLIDDVVAVLGFLLLLDFVACHPPPPPLVRSTSVRAGVVPVKGSSRLSLQLLLLEGGGTLLLLVFVCRSAATLERSFRTIERPLLTLLLALSGIVDGAAEEEDVEESRRVRVVGLRFVRGVGGAIGAAVTTTASSMEPDLIIPE